MIIKPREMQTFSKFLNKFFDCELKNEELSTEYLNHLSNFICGIEGQTINEKIPNIIWCNELVGKNALFSNQRKLMQELTMHGKADFALITNILKFLADKIKATIALHINHERPLTLRPSQRDLREEIIGINYQNNDFSIIAKPEEREKAINKSFDTLFGFVSDSDNESDKEDTKETSSIDDCDPKIVACSQVETKLNQNHFETSCETGDIIARENLNNLTEHIQSLVKKVSSIQSEFTKLEQIIAKYQSSKCQNVCFKHCSNLFLSSIKRRGRKIKQIN